LSLGGPRNVIEQDVTIVSVASLPGPLKKELVKQAKLGMPWDLRGTSRGVGGWWAWVELGWEERLQEGTP
jgi:hypothetical protein